MRYAITTVAYIVLLLRTLSAFSRRVAWYIYAKWGLRVNYDMPAAASSVRNAGEPREDLTTAPGNPTTSDRDTYTSDGRNLRRHPGKTVLVFSLVLAPLAIVPYVLVRRQVLGLRKEIADLRKVNGVAIKEMKMCTQEMSQQRAAAIEKALEMQKKNRTILSGVKSEVEASRKAVEESEVRLENIENDLSELAEAVEDMNREAAIRASDHKNMLSVANSIAKEREARAQTWRDWMITTMQMLREEKQRRCVCLIFGSLPASS